MTTHFIGEACLSWVLGERIDRDTSSRVLRAYAVTRGELLGDEPGVLDVVPSFTTIALHVDPLAANIERVRARMQAILLRTESEAAALPRGSRITLPTHYDGPDLAHVAEHVGLTARDVVRLHTAPTYTVAMIGFRPHFPYLIGLDPRLATPRRASPRVHVPAGSVAIGGAQTGVYPCDSPGGWHVIGRTDPHALRVLHPGDDVVFEAIE